MVISTFHLFLVAANLIPLGALILAGLNVGIRDKLVRADGPDQHRFGKSR